jgi:hypothetical protein
MQQVDKSRPGPEWYQELKSANSIAAVEGDIVQHARQIAALVMILELIHAKLHQIRAADLANTHHVAVQGHIRTAADYERKVLENICSPDSIAGAAARGTGQLAPATLTEAVALLEA